MEYQFTLRFRLARNAAGTVVSVLPAVAKAMPAARLVAVGPDLVGLTDVAALVGVTRLHQSRVE